jgi:NADH dehydrogenase (ubiquinone) Fe-S protein 8
MSTPRTLNALARSRLPRQSLIRTFSTTPGLAATTSGAPTPGFRLPRPERWNEKKESVWDQAGNYFLLTEMLRGMYVVLEQFFRPP